MDVNLTMLREKGSPKTINLINNPTIIGRRGDCDLRVPSMTVSRRHCQINNDNGTLRIRDLGSRNGTVINGRRIQQAELKAGDELKIGPVKFIFQIDGQTAAAGKEKTNDSEIDATKKATKRQNSPAEDEQLDELEQLEGLDDDFSGHQGQDDSLGGLPAEFDLDDQ